MTRILVFLSTLLPAGQALAHPGSHAGLHGTSFSWHMALHYAPLLLAVVLPLSALMAYRTMLAKTRGKP